MVLSMDKWKGKVAIVTGASSGIGAAISEALVDAGLMVAGLARRKDRLDEYAKKWEGKLGKFYPIKVDMTQEEEISQTFEWVTENLGPVHILINNAGIAKCQHFLDSETELWKKQIDTNFMAYLISAKIAIKSMQNHNIDGHIVNMGGIDAHHQVSVFPCNIYPVLQFSIKALTEVIRQELNIFKTKIKVTSICPGVVDTDLWDISGANSLEPYATMYENFPMLSTEDIADAIIYVLSTPPHVQVHELIIKPIGEII